MCGRYQFLTEDSLEDAELAALFLRLEEPLRHLGEVFPTHRAPVLVASETEGRMLVPMVWGFPQPTDSGVVINARAESVASKPMFRASLRTRRCVVIASGFFEWNGPKAARLKHFVRWPERKPLFMAGIYNVFPGKDEKEPRFVILTTEAHSSIAALHDRMPVVLLAEELDTWLSGDYMSLLDRQHGDLVYEAEGDVPLTLF